MVTAAVIDQQLRDAGSVIRGWGRSAVRELSEILLPGETIHQAVYGQYDAGFALLVTTDFRILLIDKKPKYLTLKDIRFDMITELDFNKRLLDATIRIYTPNRELRFTAWSGTRLRKLFTHTQHKVMEVRHRFMMEQNQLNHALSTPPGLAMTMQRYDNAIDVSPLPQGQAASGDNRNLIETTEEHVKLAAAMGAAGLKSIVYKSKVIRDYMAIPFHQRWRKRPYGYSNLPFGGGQ